MREFFKRYNRPTPAYWRKLGNRALYIGLAVAAGAGVLYMFYPELGFVKFIAAISATFATVTKALAENTVDWQKVNQKAAKNDH